jgi:1-acyl-sn-glycerol-3-phosphate acyltransferase
MIEFLRIIVKIFFKCFYRVKITGYENIPAKGGVVLCSNHIGEIDMFLIGVKSKRLVHYMAKEELFKNPLFGAIIRWLGAFPVKRGRVGTESIKTGLKLLEDGHILGIFPEGTRMKNKQNKDVKAKPGAAMFAVKAGVPVIPVAISGNYKLFSKIRVVFGKPFYLEAEKDKKYTNEDFTEMSQYIMKKVYSLLEE